MSTRKHTNPKEFDQIQLLSKAGLSTKQISEVLNRSMAFIHQTTRFSTYEDYKAYNAKRAAALAAKRAAKSETVRLPLETTESLPVSDCSADFIRIADNIAAELGAVNEKLTWLTEHVAIPERKFFRR